MSTDVHTLSGAYALHSLSVQEEAEFESHLADCASCRLETSEFWAVTAALADLERREVPARLREAVMRGIDEQRQLPPRVAVSPSDETSAEDGDEGGSASDDDGVVLRPAVARWGRSRWARGIGAAAAALALITGGGYAVSSFTEPAMTTAASQVFESSDARTLEVAVPGGGTLLVATSPGTNRLAVDARSLPDPGDDRVYQLWLVSDGDARSVTVLEPRATALTLPEPGTEIAVSVEPPGGSQVPTTTPIAQVDPAGI